MYEIGWIRLLSTILGAATHSFEIMLSVFILGLALGGLWVRKRMDRFRRPEITLAAVQIIMGLSAIATLPAYRLGGVGDGWAALRSMDRDESADGSRTVGLWMQFNVLKWLIWPDDDAAGGVLRRDDPAAAHPRDAQARPARGRRSATSTGSTRSERSPVRWSPGSC